MIKQVSSDDKQISSKISIKGNASVPYICYSVKGTYANEVSKLEIKQTLQDKFCSISHVRTQDA